MKDMKMKTKLIIGFLVPSILVLINIILGQLSTKNATVDLSAGLHHIHDGHGSDFHGGDLLHCPGADQDD